MKSKFINAYMIVTHTFAELSHCVDRKVGCIIVKNDSIIAHGYNGMPAGEDNCCELPNGDNNPGVIHAEDNAFRKLLVSTETSDGAILFTTLAPCKRCAVLIADAKIATVYYVTAKRQTEGVEYLINHKDVSIIQLEQKNGVYTCLKA